VIEKDWQPFRLHSFSEEKGLFTFSSPYNPKFHMREIAMKRFTSKHRFDWFALLEILDEALSENSEKKK
jgi:hypothetical protein